MLKKSGINLAELLQLLTKFNKNLNCASSTLKGGVSISKVK